MQYENEIRGWKMGGIFLLAFLVSLGTLSWGASSRAGANIRTKVIVRAVSHDAKAIGSGVGGALIRIRDLETQAILAEGKQEGGTGDTERIMVQPRRRGDTLYATPGAAFFEAEVLLDRPTRVEISAAAPLAYPHALQRASKTLILIPGKNLEGEGVIIELNGLIVNIQDPPASKTVKRGEEIPIRVEVKML